MGVAFNICSYLSVNFDTQLGVENCVQIYERTTWIGKKNLPSKYEVKQTLEMHDLLAICSKAWAVNSETMTFVRRDYCHPCYLSFGELYCYGYFSQPKEHLRGRAERFLCQTLSLERVSATLYKCTQIQWLPLMSLELEIICGWLGFPCALCSVSIMREGAILCLYNLYPEKNFESAAIMISLSAYVSTLFR